MNEESPIASKLIEIFNQAQACRLETSAGNISTRHAVMMRHCAPRWSNCCARTPPLTVFWKWTPHSLRKR
jgi:hypothetical protein